MSFTAYSTKICVMRLDTYVIAEDPDCRDPGATNRARHYIFIWIVSPTENF